jgi:hypothetical protein
LCRVGLSVDRNDVVVVANEVNSWCDDECDFFAIDHESGQIKFLCRVGLSVDGNDVVVPNKVNSGCDEECNMFAIQECDH